MRFTNLTDEIHKESTAFKYLKIKKVKEFLELEEELIKQLEEEKITIEQFKEKRRELLGVEFTWVEKKAKNTKKGQNLRQ